MEDKDFTITLKGYLSKFKTKALKTSFINYHDCGHDDHSKCKNVVEVL